MFMLLPYWSGTNKRPANFWTKQRLTSWSQFGKLHGCNVPFNEIVFTAASR